MMVLLSAVHRKDKHMRVHHSATLMIEVMPFVPCLEPPMYKRTCIIYLARWILQMNSNQAHLPLLASEYPLDYSQPLLSYSSIDTELERIVINTDNQYHDKQRESHRNDKQIGPIKRFTIRFFLHNSLIFNFHLYTFISFILEATTHLTYNIYNTTDFSYYIISYKLYINVHIYFVPGAFIHLLIRCLKINPALSIFI